MDVDIKFGHLLSISHINTLTSYVIENRKLIDKKYYKQIAFSYAISLAFTPFHIIEEAIFAPKELKEPVKPPLFVLGHWRSGTTLLQYFLSRDNQFGFLNARIGYTINFYHTMGIPFCKALDPLIGASRPMDNLEITLDHPVEEYVPLSTFEPNGVYPLNFFPKAFCKYANNAFPDRMPEKKRNKWVRSYDKFLRKVAYFNDGKRLILKSPDATARVKFMSEMYPGSKFVNIYRNPYAVIRSTKHLYDKMFDVWALSEVPDEEEMEDMIIDFFKEVYEAYFEEIKTLPEGSLYEIKFEEFEKDPLPLLEEMYKVLDLGDYERVRTAMADYWKTYEDYKKNEFDYPERLIKKVNEKLGFYFEHYGYEMKEI